MPALTSILSIITEITKVSKIQKSGSIVDGILDGFTGASEAADALEGLNKEQVITITNLLGLDAADKKTILSMLGLETTEAELTTTTTGLSGAITGLASSLGISVGALTAAVAAIAAIAVGVGVAVYKIHQANEELRNSAKELGSAFNDTKSDIESYKTQIKSLYETINSETSSTNERREAREKLLSIQDEMLAKYGQEAESIGMITGAINGEIEALDKLTEAEWRRTKREFNQQNLKGWDGGNRLAHHAKDNVDLMLKEMENREITIEFQPIYDKDAINEFKNLYGGSITPFDDATGYYTISGNLEDIQEKLVSIQGISENMNLSSTFTNNLNGFIKQNDEILDSYSDFYQNLILQDRIYNSEFEDNYISISDKISKYNKSLVSEDENEKEAALKALKDEYDKLVQEVNNKYYFGDAQQKAIAESILDFFEDLHPELSVYVNTERLQSQLDEVITSGDYGHTTRTRGQNINDAIAKFSSKEELFYFDPSSRDATDPLVQAYNAIKIVADNAGMSVEQLYEYLVETKQLSAELMSQKPINAYVQAHNLNSRRVANKGEFATGATFANAINSLDETEREKINNYLVEDWHKWDEIYKKLRDDGVEEQEAIREAVKETNKVLEEQADKLDEINQKQQSDVSHVDSINTLQSATSSLSGLYNENQQINTGKIDANTINSVEQAFMNLSEKDDSVDADAVQGYIEEFEQTLIRFPNDAEKAQEAIDKLVTSYIDQTEVMKNLTEENKDWTIQQLKEQGIVNAEEVVMDRLYNKYALTSQELQTLTDSYAQYSENLKSSQKGTEEYSNALESLKNDIQNAINSMDNSSGEFLELPEIDDNFVQNHLDLVQQAAQGDLEALQQVRAEASKDAFMKVHVEVPTEVAQANLDEIWKYVNELDGMNLEMGATLDDGPIITAFQNIVRNGKASADDVAKALGAMGYEAEWIPNPYEATIAKGIMAGGGTKNTSADIATSKGIQALEAQKVKLDVPSLRIKSAGGSSGGLSKQAHYKPTSSGSSGGGGGGGHTPTEHTPKDDSMDKAADAMQDAADAAKDAFEEEKRVAEELIDITYMDWVERLLNNIEKKVNKWTKTIDRMFTYWNKNWATNKALRANEAAINAQQRAYTTYMKQADKAAKQAGMSIKSNDEEMTFEIVGGEKLSKKYKKYIRDGKFAIEEFNGTKDSVRLNKKIQAYIEWYEKAQACKDAIEELYEAETQLIEQKLNNVLEYFGTLENYFNSFISKIDSKLGLKEASGERLSLNDILEQYGANSDAIRNLQEERLAYLIGGYNGSGRSIEDIQKDLEPFDTDITNSDYYKTLINRQAILEEKEAAYQAKQDEIADIKEKISNEKDKVAKKELKKQLSTLKSEAKKLKLSKTEKSDLTAVRKQLKTLDENIQNGIANNVIASTAAYQKLISDIANLEKKEASEKGLTKDQKNKLSMLRDELNAINQGVLVDQLSNFITVYQKWWKLNNKLQTKGVLSKKENLEYKQLEEQKNEMKKAFDEQKKGLEEELESALQLSGQKGQDLNRAYNKQVDDIKKLYGLRKDNTIYSYKTTSAYQKWRQEKETNDAAITTQEQIKAKQQAIMDANAPSSKKYKDAKKKYDEAVKKLASLNKKKATYNAQESAFNAGATDINFTDYFKAYKEYTEAEEYFQKHGKYKDNAQRKAHDSAKNKLDAWNNQKAAEIGMIDKELSDTLERIQKEYVSKSNELEKNIADQQAKGWELVRQALELQMTYLEQDIANYEAMVSTYKTIANILANTDMKTIEEYNLADILDIDTSDSISDLISDNILNALYSAKDKLATHSALYDIYGSLIEAAENKDFSSVLTDSFLGKLSDGARTRLQEMLAQAENNDWDGNKWVQEWASARAQVVSDVANSIEAIQELKDTLRETVVFKAVRDAIDSLENLNNRLSAMSNIINNDWVQDENGLTEYGRAKIMLLANEAQNAQQIVQNAAKHIQEVQDAQLNEDTKYKNEAEYQKALTEAWSEYSNALQNVYSIDNEIYELSKKQQEAEVNRLSKVIDLRKKALANKKAYYDYDKTIKSKTKNIEALEAELKALNGVNDAASKARIKQLQSDLADAREDLEDTKKEHEYDMQINALDKLLEDYSESLDNSAKSIKDTFEQWAQQIRDAIDASSGVDVDKALNDILSFMMTVPDNTSLQNDGSNSSEQQPSNTDVSIHLYDPEGVYSGNTTPSTVASDISVGNLVSLTDTQISNNYLEKLVEMSSMAQNTLNDIVSNTQSITNKLFESSIDVIPKYEDVYSSRLYDTVQSIDSKFNGSMSDLINATNKAGTSQQVSFTLPKNMTTSQLNNLFNQLKKLGVNFVYK